MKPLLFAYGSMKRGFRNHYRLENDKFIGQAKTKKKYCMFPAPSYNYPYGIEDDRRWQLKGELYELTNTPIETIDDFEGAPAYYYRKMIKVVCNNKDYDAYILPPQKSRQLLNFFNSITTMLPSVTFEYYS